ncbi:MAG TPA: glycosyltransferase family 4 protein [Pyrinomonadaceae bacterium]|jgi:glycosyltransferase involved in cell wall biosynthesis|nr:glycosyltransferase family 4 protein [Pyrinomonadaceae bacterium]
MAYPNTAFLLDSAPRTWSSQEDRHLRLCQELAARGSRPVLVFSSPLPPEIQNRFEQGGVSVAAINYADGITHYYRELGKLFEQNSIERVHIIFFDYFRAVMWLARLNGVKSIIYEMQNGGVFKATSWKRQLIHARNRFMTAPLVRIIAISEFIKGQLVAGGVPAEKIVVRHLGIDTNRFKPDPQARQRLVDEFAIRSDEIILSTVSYLRPIKSPEIIVQACGLLAERGVPVRLFVGGDGEMLKQLQQLSHSLGIADRVHWLGLVTDPLSLLQASDIFLLATVGEAFGLVLAEAMACGVPVVGSRAGAIPEVVEDQKTGLLVEPKSAAAMADAIEILARDEAKRNRMGQASIERVHTYFTLEQTVAETRRIYDSL